MSKSSSDKTKNKGPLTALVLGVVIGLVALAYFAKGVEFKSIWTELRQIQLGWVSASIALLLGEICNTVLAMANFTETNWRTDTFQGLIYRASHRCGIQYVVTPPCRRNHQTNGCCQKNKATI